MRILLDTNLWVAALISVSMRSRIEHIIADDRLEILADLFGRPSCIFTYW